MKARYNPQLTRREVEMLSDFNRRELNRYVCRAQWLLMIAINEECGIGERRFERILTQRLPKILEEYGGYMADGVADEILERRLRKMFPNTFDGLYP